MVHKPDSSIFEGEISCNIGSFETGSASNYWLTGNLVDGWEMVKPLCVTEQLDPDGSYLISEDVFPVYGVGPTSADARFDFAQSLVDLYHCWESDTREGNVPAISAREMLKQYIRPSA